MSKLNGRKISFAKLHATIFVPGALVNGKRTAKNLTDRLEKGREFPDLEMTKVEDGILAQMFGLEVFIPSAQIVCAVLAQPEAPESVKK